VQMPNLALDETKRITVRTTEKNVEPLLIYALFGTNKHVLANLGLFCNAISAAILRVYIVHGHSVYSRLDAEKA
jgi:hypothetical protein